jgi:mannose-1-phosphate guanylyltransferase/phosphomannomutase
MKGLVMRVLTEQLKGRELDLTDGIKVIDERGWAEVLPDPDEPLVHVYAEGATEELSAELEAELHELIEDAMQGQETGLPAQISS